MIGGDTVTGVQTFRLNKGSPRNVAVDYFYFVDGNDNIVAATGGRVEITMSPVAGLPRKMVGGSFDAESASDVDWVMPYFYGRAIEVTVDFTAIVGAAGFKMLVSAGEDTPLFMDESGLNDVSMGDIFREALLQMTEQQSGVLSELKLLNARFEAMAETHLDKNDLEK